MKIIFVLSAAVAFHVFPFALSAQPGKNNVAVPKTAKTLFIDVHKLGPGKASLKDVAGAHAKDLATQAKYGVHFIHYWFDESKGIVYCLSSANDSASVIKTHAEAHGLLPQRVYKVTDGTEAALTNEKNFFLDVHYLGAGKVTADAVEAAHQKDLTVQHKHGVNFINYWVDEKAGIVMCLSQAKDSTSVIETHKEAHGLIPATVLKVKQGE
jgi:phenolic acid decarboxylase